jgi:hypothetical protein
MSVKKFQPCNGTHGEMFMSEYCFTCSKWAVDSGAKGQCKIRMHTQIFRVEDDEYPIQWCYVDEEPTCTAYKNRDEYNRERREKRKPSSSKCKLTIDLFSEE